MRYGYFAYELRKTSINDLRHELVGFAEVNPVMRKYDTPVTELHRWALDLLHHGRHEAGLFTFTYSEVVEYDELGKPLAELMLAWDGVSEFARAEQAGKQ
jgi:hypothetical protein